MIARIIFPATIALLALPYFLIAQAYPEMSLQEGFGPGFFPSIIAAVVGVLALVEALTQLRHYIRERQRGNTSGMSLGEHLGIEWREVLGAGLLVVTVAATVLAVPYIGFTAAACALVFVLSIAMGMRPIWLSALVSLLVGVSIHTIFSQVFGLVIAF